MTNEKIQLLIKWDEAFEKGLVKVSDDPDDIHASHVIIEGVLVDGKLFLLITKNRFGTLGGHVIDLCTQHHDGGGND